MSRVAPQVPCRERADRGRSPCRPLAVALRLALGFVLLGAATGCSGDAPPALEIDAGTATVRMDDAGGLKVSGARPGEPVTITAAATDGSDTAWSSTATFTASADGTVDTAQDAPSSGDYAGAHATGMVFSMVGDDDQQTSFVTTEGALTVRYRATQDGRGTGTAEQQRSLLLGLTTTDATLRDDGIVGTLYSPQQPTPGAAAVLVLGGSDGGSGSARTVAAALAQNGHPALGVAYFGDDGLPDALAGIPIEYFGTALRWLAQQPGVDPDTMVIQGASRGSEAALLTAYHFPDLLAGVVVTSPTSFLNPGFPDPATAAWTWKGRPLPDGTFGQVAPAQEDADIDVASIPAPMLLICGEDDQLWPSCPSADRIAARSPRLTRTVVKEPGAGHLVDFLVPGLPISSGVVTGDRGPEPVGGTTQADAVGRLDAMSELLGFLDRL